MTKARKKQIAGLFGVVFTVVAAGTAWALLTAGPKEAFNHFTVTASDGIDAELSEPGWQDGAGDGLTPNVPVAKDPMIKNTSESGMPIYVGMQILFCRGNGADFTIESLLPRQNLERLEGSLLLRYNTSEMVRNLNTPQDTGKNSDSEGVWIGSGGHNAVYVWSQPLVQGESTAPLFRDVLLRQDTTETELQWIAQTMDAFDIVIRGAAVQSDGLTLAGAREVLDKMLAIEEVEQ